MTDFWGDPKCSNDINANPQLTTLKGHRINIYIHLGLSKMFHCTNKIKMVLFFFYFIKIIPLVLKKKYQILVTSNIS